MSNYGIALRRASAALRAEAAEIEANWQPTPFDDALPINDDFWPEGHTLLPSYIDEADEKGEAIDFRALATYILDRRTLAIKKRGVIYDPIDDAFAIPRYTGFLRFMRSDQVEKHQDELFSAGLDIIDIWRKLPKSYIEANRKYLEEQGIKRKAIRRALGETLLKNIFKKS